MKKLVQAKHRFVSNKKCINSIFFLGNKNKTRSLVDNDTHSTVVFIHNSESNFLP